MENQITKQADGTLEKPVTSASEQRYRETDDADAIIEIAKAENKAAEEKAISEDENEAEKTKKSKKVKKEMTAEEKLNATRKLTLTGIFLGVSFALSLLEWLVPIGAIIPLPGIKLGIANIAVTAALYVIDRKSAFIITVLRPLLTLILFGNVTSCILSLCGGLLAFLSQLITKYMYDRIISFSGVSVISAVCHSIGQICAASVVVGGKEIFMYLPLLCVASSITGFVCGIIMNIVIPRLKKAFIKIKKKRDETENPEKTEKSSTSKKDKKNKKKSSASESENAPVKEENTEEKADDVQTEETAVSENEN